MTNEEAISLLNKITSYCDFTDEYGDMIDSEPYYEAIDFAIKVLEQTDVLDKVRAEIASYGAIWVEYIIPGHTDRDIEKIVENVLREAKEQVLDIIDKYKAESEEL